jgi:hypothetical protein
MPVSVNWGDLLRVANSVSVVALVLLILYAGYKRWWVWGWTFDAETKRGEQWRTMALNSTSTTESAIDSAANLLNIVQLRDRQPAPAKGARRRRTDSDEESA